ncbi:MAG: M48 family metalloprotease [Lewinellaceae bacterium]|nr:M48 family metalloprotease [Lewinellaceae bacterium]
MSTITHWINPGLAKALGWALLHSLWQGALIALALAFLLILMRRQAPSARYWISVSAMVALLLAFIGTFAWKYEPGSAQAVLEPAMEMTGITAELQEVLPAGTALFTDEEEAGHPTVFLQYFEKHLPLLATGWLLGVLLLSLRMLGEIAYIQHLRNYRCRQPEDMWLEKLARMQEQMGIRRPVKLLETYRVHSPMAFGVFKQVILLPVGLLSGLSTGQVEAMLAHELAHIRRRDYLANLILSLAEVLLFFNPMMWWISKKTRAEREHACDDLALEVTGDATALAHSLALLEEWRLRGLPMAMAFTGRDGSALNRIRRLLQRDDKRQVAAKGFWAVSIACACLALLAFQAKVGQQPLSAKTADSSIAETPFSAWQGPGSDSKAESALAQIPEKGMARNEDEATAYAPATVRFHGDTIPAEAARIEDEMRKLEKDMQAENLSLRKKEQAMRTKELQIRKESQQAMQGKQKALMELEMQIRTKEHEREMLDNEAEMAQQELEAAQMVLEEQQYALDNLQEQIEQAEGKNVQEKLKAYQEKQKQVLEQERALEVKQFEAEKKRRAQAFEKEKSIQELQTRRFQLEQEVQTLEQDMEFKMMQLRHELQQVEADRQMKEQEIEARHRELESKLMKLMGDDENDEDDEQE